MVTSTFSGRPLASLLRPPGLVLGAATALTGLVLVVGTVGTAGAQTAPPPPTVARPLASLKTVAVPEPPNLAQFLNDATPGSASRTAAIRLGKALFWDMQVGSDGVQACASCHFEAGADSRTKNQVSPGLLATPQDRTFQVGGGPNYTLTAADFPFHKVDPATGAVVADANDVVSSQGVFRRDFLGVVTPPGSSPPGAQVDTSVDSCTNAGLVPDPQGFSVGGTNVRRVEPRNAPTVIDAIFNFRNFWDGRANNNFNGANPFGNRDPNNHIWKLVNGQLQQVHIEIPNGSLASQAVGPPGSPFEMSCADRAFENIGKKLLAAGVMPLAKQRVDPTDSVLGPIANSQSSPSATGLRVPYASLIRQAFNPAYWIASNPVTMTGPQQALEQVGGMSLIPVQSNVMPPSTTFNQMQANFSLFFGLSVQLYEATLVANNTPFDQFMEGNTAALTAQQQQGLAVFTGPGKCVACHGGPELTNASVANVANERLERMHMGNDGIAVYDDGFYNTAVRPTADDAGVGGTDPFGNPLSETRFCQKFVDQGLSCPIRNQDANGQLQSTGIADLIAARPGESIVADRLRPQMCPGGVPAQQTSIFDPTTGTFVCDRTNVLGAFKTPQLRNVELTGPYMHNGGMATLRQVVDFYNRGGDFAQANQDNLDPNIVPLGLTEDQKNALVAFMVGLTDERVRFERAPFDHPQLFIPNGHPGDTTAVTPDPNKPGQATDSLLQLPAVGAGGSSTPIRSFTAAVEPVMPTNMGGQLQP
jgi:cytochrome c peroxidase